MTQEKTHAPHLAIFASSSETLPEGLPEAVGELAGALAESGWNLVFGGANRGLMNVAATAFADQGRHIVSVIPEAFDRRGLSFSRSSLLIRTSELRERKRIMAEHAHAFLALPGGPGTLDEFVEVLSLKMVGMSEAPLVLFEPDGEWRSLMALFEDMKSRGFAYRNPLEYFICARTQAEVLQALPVAGTRLKP